MPLSNLNYNKLCQSVGIPQSQRNYQKGYLYCDGLFNTYFQNVTTYLNSESPKKVILLFLESCPENTANYIFGTPNKPISFLNDSYLWNIYTGFLGANPIVDMTKGDCLNALLNYKTNQGLHVPVIILDLFPLHGIDLKGYRKEICKRITNPRMLCDVVRNVNSLTSNVDRLFLFGVPYSIWNYSGGYGNGSIYMDNLSEQTGLLGRFSNNSVVVNIGGQNISSKTIHDWRKNENIA